MIELLSDYDVIVDGADNFPTRYLLNDASVRLKKPVVSASILSFDGQISTFVPFEGPCYRCLYPTPPPAELAPSCGAAGVLGVLPGIMGLLQALEVVKLVTGAGQPLIGRLLLFEALGTEFTELKVRRDPDCPICGRTLRRWPTRISGSSRITNSSARAEPVRRGPVGFRECRRSRSHQSFAPRPAANRSSRSRGPTSSRCSRPWPKLHPGVAGQLFDDGGELNRYVNVYLNDEDVRLLDGLGTDVGAADTVVILPAMAGGR